MRKKRIAISLVFVAISSGVLALGYLNFSPIDSSAAQLNAGSTTTEESDRSPASLAALSVEDTGEFAPLEGEVSAQAVTSSSFGFTETSKTIALDAAIKAGSSVRIIGKCPTANDGVYLSYEIKDSRAVVARRGVTYCKASAFSILLDRKTPLVCGTAHTLTVLWGSVYVDTLQLNPTCAN